MTNESDRPRNDPEGAEFDEFAADYSGGMENSVKALLGSKGDDFLDVKVDWLLRRIFSPGEAQANFAILDYGCGRGDLLRLLAKRGIKARLLGSEVSGAMLREGTKIWPVEHAPLPAFLRQKGARVPCDDASIDLILISSVLHHVPVADRSEVYREIKRLLKPAGRVVVFEHNPLNPVTRYVVSHTPIDRNAILLSADEVESGLLNAGLTQVKTAYLMFAPPRFRSLGSHLDGILGWLPFGAQYAVSAIKDG